MKNIIAAVILATLIFTSCVTVNPGKVSVVEMMKNEQELRSDALDMRGDETKPENTWPKEYTVKEGDSLWKIARLFYSRGIGWSGIADSNKITEPFIIRPGKKLAIPEYTVIGLKTGRPVETTKPFEFRVIPNKAWGVGEKLVFAVRYFNVTAGFGTLEVKALETMNNRPVYHLEITAKTAPFFETFFRVKDVISSWMDAYGLFSWKYSKKLEEGTYRNYTDITFDHENATALKNNGDKCEITRFCQDIVSEFYFFRSVYKGEDEIFIDVASDECKTYKVKVKKLRYEKVTTDSGEFDCVVVQPLLAYEGIFRQQGEIIIWLTNDERLMPVMVKSSILIGTIDAVLVDARVVR